MSETGHIGINVAIWGVVAAGAVTAILAFPPHWAVWASVLLWLLLWLVAILGLSDGPSRAFLSGTLRRSTYTQIYTALTRRNVMWVWGKVCDPAGERESWPTLFRAALTWRLYDTALLLAVVYPLLLLVGQWTVTGQGGRVGTALVLPAAEFWPERAAVLGGYAILTLGVVARKLATASRHRVVRQAADWLLIAVVAFAFAGAVAFAFLTLVAVLTAVVFARVAAGAAASAAGSTAFFAGAGAFAFASAFLFAAWALLDWLYERGRQAFARRLLTGLLIVEILALVALIDWSSIDEDRRSLFLFLAVFPLLNALFDVVSYAITLSLLRRGLRAAWPFLWGALDLLIACGLFLALGATLVAVVHGLNGLAGVPLLDLGALFAGVHERPGEYVWLYLMLFSTIVPTALHFAVSLLGVQGLWPRVVRRPIAGWVQSADRSPRQAVPAALGLGVIWTVPLIALGGAVWLIWQFGGGLMAQALGRYFDALLWIAAVPVGTF